MPSFSYVAREAASGREIRNVLEANSEQEAIATLLGRNLLVVTIQESTGKKGRAASGAVPLQDLVMFTRQLSTMIEAGLAIVQSLQALAEQTTNKIMRDVIRDICARVESGDNFSAALMKHPKTFDRLYYSMVDAGEKGGLLAEILSRLATYLENTVRLRKKVKSAMMYPTVVTLVAISITCFLLVKVVPTFGEIFSGFGAKLPAPTQFLIDLSEWMKKWWWAVLLGIILGLLLVDLLVVHRVGHEVHTREAAVESAAWIGAGLLFGIAVLVGIESLLCAVVADGMSGDRHDSDTELAALARNLRSCFAP